MPEASASFEEGLRLGDEEREDEEKKMRGRKQGESLKERSVKEHEGNTHPYGCGTIY